MIKKVLLSIGLVFCVVNSAYAVETPARNITVTTNTFAHCLTVADSNVQTALNDIDVCLGQGTTLNFTDSLVNSNGTITLVNDSASPGNTMYYGTNGSGTKGFFSVPSSSAVWGSITGTLSNQTDLQNALNAKQATGNYITALTGDGSASGPGSAVLTLATVNSNTGSFTNANITVNGKGLITAVSNGAATTNYWLNTAAAGNVGISTTNTVGIGTTGNGTGQLIVMGGNVGIGSNTPNSTLTVTGSISNTSAAGNQIEAKKFFAGTTALVDDGTGNNSFYIGRTATSIAPNGYLVLEGNSAVSGGSNTTLVGFNSGTGLTSGSTDTMVGYLTTAGSGTLSNATAIGANATVNSSNALVLGSGANVGIGSSSPGQILDVKGTARMTGFTLNGNGAQNTYVLTATDSSGDATWSAPAAGGSNYWSLTTGVGNVGISTTNSVGIGTTGAGNGQLIVMGGNVGIGTINPAVLLDVKGTTRMTGFTLNGNGAQNTYVLTATDSSGDATWQASSGGGGSNYWNLYAGNVGIGTFNNVGLGSTNPSYILDVQGTTRFTGNIILQNPIDNTAMFIGQGAGIGIGTYQSGNMAMGVDALNAQTTGTADMAFGYQSGQYMSAPTANGSGLQGNPQANTLFGYQAGQNMTTAREMTCFGFQACEEYTGANIYIEDGTATAVGSMALKYLNVTTSDSDDTAIGQKAGLNDTTGIGNTFLGTHTGDGVTTADSDTFVGDFAGAAQTDTSGVNVVIGAGAGGSLAGGSNVIIGGGAGNSLEGSQNVVEGLNAANQSNNDMMEGVVDGASSGYSLTTSFGPVLIGYEAGFNVTTAANPVLIGYQAGDSKSGEGSGLTTGGSDIFLGNNTGNWIPGNLSNTFIAGSDSSGGYNNSITNVYFGNGYGATTPVDFTLDGTIGIGTNVAGANVGIAGGQSTGSVNGGSIFLKVSPAGTSGNSTNSLITAATVSGTGNVGIGSTNPGQALDVVGTARMTAFNMPTGASNTYVLTSDSNGNGTWQASSGGGGTNYWKYSSSGNIGISTSLPVGIGTTFIGGTGENQFTVMGGNVGIGTWLSNFTLTVAGSEAIGVQANNTLSSIPSGMTISNGMGYNQINGAGNAYKELISYNYPINGAEVVQLSNTSSGTGQDPAYAPYGYWAGTASIPQFEVSSTGNVGIGTSNLSNAALTVMQGNVGIGTWIPRTTLDVEGTLSVTDFGGNVGIGTFMPNHALDIVANDTTTTLSSATLADAEIANNNSATNNNFASLDLSTADTNGAYKAVAKIVGVATSHTVNSVSGDFAVLTKNIGTTTEKLRVTGVGNVGIGSSNPGQLLDVQGTIRINGTGNFIGTNGGIVNLNPIVCGNGVLPTGTAVGIGTTSPVTILTSEKIQPTAYINGALSGGNCSCTVDVLVNGSSITATNYLTLTSATSNTQSTSSWTTALAATNTVSCNVRSCTCDNWGVTIPVSD